MKSIVILIALTLSVNLSQANNTDKSVIQLMSQKVRASLFMPESMKQQGKNQTVSIWFSVDNKGCVTDVMVNTKDKEAKADLEKQFKLLNFKGLNADVYNSIDVSFVVR